MFRDRPLDFPVGEKMSYSNSGYLVLGHLIEKLSGGSYEAFVQANLFTPIGMADSGYDSNTRHHRAPGRRLPARSGGFTNAGFVHMTVPHAAGALYSTTGDLLKWEQALFGGKVLSAASLPEDADDPTRTITPTALSVQITNGRKAVAHNGGIDGFNTAMAHYPDSGFTIIVLGNVNGPRAGPDAAAAGRGRPRRDGAAWPRNARRWQCRRPPPRMQVSTTWRPGLL